MFRRIATASSTPAAAAGISARQTGARRTALMLHSPVDASTAEVRTKIVENHVSVPVVAFVIFGGAASLIGLGKYLRTQPASEVGPAYWFGKFALARYDGYNAPAMSK